MTASDGGQPQAAPRIERRGLFAFLALILLLLLVLVPYAPPAQPVPFRDQGVYLYTGQRLLAGAALYRDAWDHKAPVIHAINAIGQAITPGSAWGVWSLQALMLTAAVGLSLRVLRAAFGLTAAIVGVVAWVAGLSLVASGNMIQEYALLFQFASLSGFVAALGSPHPRAYGLLTGLMMALAFWSQPNLIALSAGIGVALLLAWLRGRSRQAEVALWLAAVGFLAFSLVLVALFALAGTLPDLWTAVFSYNALYGGGVWLDRVRSFQFGVGMLAPTGAPFIAFAGWAAALIALVSRRWSLRALHPLVVVVLVALPLEILLAVLSGRNYQHYFVSWLPSLAVLVAFAASLLLRGVRRQSVIVTPPAVWLVAMVAAILLLPALDWLQRLDTLGPTPATTAQLELVAYVRRETTPDDMLLVWGAQPVYNWLAERASPTRFSYQYALYTDGFQSAALFSEVVADLQRQPPALILDTSTNDGSIPPIDDSRRAQWLDRIAPLRRTNPQYRLYNFPPEMDALFDYVQTHYERVGSIGGVAVWRRR